MERSWRASRSTLDDLIRASARPLPDRDLFLRAWIAFLRKRRPAPRPTAGSGRPSACWRGPRASKPSPARRGRRTLRAYLDWLAALATEGKPAEVVAAAREAPQGVAGRTSASARHRRPPVRGGRGTRRSPRPSRKAAGKRSPPSRPSAACSTSGSRRPRGDRVARMRQAERHLVKALERQSRRSGRDLDEDEDFEDDGGDLLEAPGWVSKPAGTRPAARRTTGRRRGTGGRRTDPANGVGRTSPRAWSSRPAWSSSRAGRRPSPPTWPASGSGAWRRARSCPSTTTAPRTWSV